MIKDIEAYKTIKVPLWVYENAKQVELTLIRKGIEHIPSEVLQPDQCPICRSELRPLQTQESKYEYVQCVHCGYTQQRFEPTVEGVMLGTAIGMGLVYLLNALHKN